MAHLLLAHRPVRRLQLVALIGLLLAVGFATTIWISYLVSKTNIRDLIVVRELPLTSDTVYSEIQKDLVRPIFVSSMMASDTFLRDWVLHGEKDVTAIAKYLQEVKTRYGAVTSYFISERSGNYYHPTGIARQVRAGDPKEAWYFRVKAMAAAYEINVDTDYVNRDAMTIFVNYRVFDYQQRFIGVTGVGLTVDAVQRLMADYQQRYRRIVYFVDSQGRIVLPGAGPKAANIAQVEGLGAMAGRLLAEKTGSYQYEADGRSHLLHTRHVPELNWYLFVEKIADEEFADIRQTLIANLIICAGITGIVLALINLIIARYQRTMRASREESLRIISHDLRSPLASIVTLADDAAGACPTRLEQAGRYAKGALDLADNLVRLARAEAAERQRFVELDLASVAEEAGDAVWVAADKKRIEIRRQLDPDTPVTGDRGLLRQALTNLLDNAVKYSPEGSVVELTVRRHNGRCEATISDHGPGIAPERLPDIFLPYHRAQAAGAPRQPGVGLGLAIVKAVADRHGGKVEVASVPGQGCCFRLTLLRAGSKG